MEAINSVIGEGAVFTGEINLSGPLQIAGELKGTVCSKSDVFIVEKGRVIGDVSGARIVVSGYVEGNIFATKGLEILKAGKVHGEISCDKMLIEEGGHYEGKVSVRTLEHGVA
jgi:cytoskeletal protein CcmA (bactofilin family)